MTEEKQIDEISKLICNFPQCVYYNSIGECANTECQIVDKAKILYNAGYRKQSEGEWIADYDTGGVVLQCSLCREQYWIEDERERKPNYCPGCGAKMKGGEKHEH